MACQAHASELEGTLNSNLFTEVFDNVSSFHDMYNNVNNFLETSNNYLKGETWDLFRDKTHNYNSLVNLVLLEGINLNDTIALAINIVLEYLGNDTDIDTNQLPELYSRKEKLEDNISELSTLIQNSNEHNNQNRSVDYLISSLHNFEKELELIRKRIEKIEGLEDVMKAASVIVMKAIQKIGEISNAIDIVDGGNTNDGYIRSEVNNYINRNPLLATLATIRLGSDMLGYGALKAGENIIIDGPAYILATSTVGIENMFASVLSFVGLDNVANAINQDANAFSRQMANWISVDQVENLMGEYYNTNLFGALLNTYSYRQYDSATMDAVYHGSTVGTTVGAEMIIGAYFGQAGSTFCGFLSGIGASNETIFQEMKDPMLVLDERILLSGASGAIKGYIGGSAGQELAALVGEIQTSGLFGYVTNEIADVNTYNGRNLITRALNRYGYYLTTPEEQADIVVETILGSISGTIDDSLRNNTDITADAYLRILGGEVVDQFVALKYLPAAGRMLSIINDGFQAAGFDTPLELIGQNGVNAIINN